MAAEATGFDPIRYKETTPEQWQTAAEPWYPVVPLGTHARAMAGTGDGDDAGHGRGRSRQAGSKSRHAGQQPRSYSPTPCPRGVKGRSPRRRPPGSSVERGLHRPVAYPL
jgi:hypothetical protein